MASSRRALASSLSSSSILAACLRRLASLSATSSWFSVNHAIRFSSSATRAPCLLSSSASCAASTPPLSSSRSSTGSIPPPPAIFASAARAAARAASRSRTSSRSRSPNSSCAVLSDASAASCLSRYRAPSPPVRSVSSRSRAISPLSRSIVPVKSPSLTANSRRIAAIVAVALSFSFWYPRMMASCVWISRRMDSASSTETHFTSIEPLAIWPHGVDAALTSAAARSASTRSLRSLFTASSRAFAWSAARSRSARAAASRDWHLRVKPAISASCASICVWSARFSAATPSLSCHVSRVFSNALLRRICAVSLGISGRTAAFVGGGGDFFSTVEYLDADLRASSATALG